MERSRLCKIKIGVIEFRVPAKSSLAQFLLVSWVRVTQEYTEHVVSVHVLVNFNHVPSYHHWRTSDMHAHKLHTFVAHPASCIFQLPASLSRTHTWYTSNCLGTWLHSLHSAFTKIPNTQAPNNSERPQPPLQVVLRNLLLQLSNPEHLTTLRNHNTKTNASASIP